MRATHSIMVTVSGGLLASLLFGCVRHQNPPAATAPSAASGAQSAAQAPPTGNMLFWKPEQTLVGFRTIDKIYPTHAIASGSHAYPLPKRADEPRVEFDFGGTHYDT